MILANHLAARGGVASMAVSGAVLRPIGAAQAIAAEAARFASRNIKATVVISVVLICGAFAAASALQMRFERVHALAQAQYFETRRAGDIAAVVEENLDRFEALGKDFADGRPIAGAGKALRNIAVFGDGSGAPATWTGGMEFVRIPAGIVALGRKGRVLIGGGGLATMIFPHRGDAVALSFDAEALAPSEILRNASISAAGTTLVGIAPSGEDARAHARGWPVTISIAPDGSDALHAWYGSLPLYFFVIFGPALVGAGLSALFVGEFEKRAKANRAVKALRATSRPDARLLVRLAQAERDAIEARRTKAEFVAHMSHELRTPLNAVIGFSEIIERGMFGAVGHSKYAEYARDIGTAGRGLHAKIGDILEYANLEAGHYPLRPATFNIAEVAATIVEEQTGRAFSRRIALSLTPSPPLPVRADPQAVRKILVSLLTNALDYTPAGGRVRVALAAADTHCIVSVQDSGPGFKPEESASAGRAFGRFDRAGAKTGSGLGLAIAMSLAGRMGGALRLSSKPGEGTRTELWIRRD